MKKVQQSFIWPHQKNSWKNAMPSMWITVWNNSSNWMATSIRYMKKCYAQNLDYCLKNLVQLNDHIKKIHGKSVFRSWKLVEVLILVPKSMNKMCLEKIETNLVFLSPKASMTHYMNPVAVGVTCEPSSTGQFWGFVATLFVNLEHRKCERK